MSLKDDILRASDLKKVLIEIPEWSKQKIYVRELTGAERADVIEKEKDDSFDKRTYLVMLSLVDEHGNRLFQESDLKALASKSARILDRIFQKALELCKMDEDGVQEAEKN